MEEVSLADAYDAKNKRHVDRELMRYVTAGRRVLNNAQFLTMSGPDDTKVGTDFCVAMAAIGDSTTQKVALVVPQDFVVALGLFR